MKLIAIGGEPATGKSTLMRLFMAEIEQQYQARFIDAKPVDLVYGHHLKVENGPEIFIIGKYDDPDQVFPGTDRLSMAVQPEAKKYIESNKDNPNLVVVFEGDRIFNLSFLDFVYETIGEDNLFIFMIEASKETIKQRHIDRADDQDDKFINGRRTKYANICSDMVLMDRIRTFKHEDHRDSDKILTQMKMIVDVGYSNPLLPC